MATVSASSFFGGKVPPPAKAPAAPAKKPNLIQRVGAAFDKRVDAASDAIVKDQNPASKAIQALGQGAGFIGDVAVEGARSLPSQIKEPIKAAMSAIPVPDDPAIQEATKKYEAFKVLHPEAAANLEAAGLLGSLLPVGRAAKLATDVAAKGGAAAAQQAAKAAVVSGRATSGVGETVFKSAITPTVREAQRIQSFRSSAPFLTRVRNQLTATDTKGKPVTRADTALENGIWGREKDIGVQADRAANELWNNTIAPAVKGSKEVVTKDELFAPIIKRISETAEPGRAAALQDAFNALRAEYKAVTNFTLEQAQKVKKGLDEFTPEKVFGGKSIVNEYRTLQNDMANAIRNKTYEALKDQNIRKAYLDYGNLAELRKIGVKALTNAKGKGGWGSFWTGVWDMATVPAKTIGGQVLYRVGNKLEFLGEKGIKTFGEFLQQKGFEPPSS